MTKKTKYLINEAKRLYESGWGYQRISNHFWEIEGIRLSPFTIRNWIKQLGLQPHDSKGIKSGTHSWCKKELKQCEAENMKLKEDLEDTRRICEELKEENKYLKRKIRELEQIIKIQQEMIDYLYKRIYKEWAVGNIDSIQDVVKSFSQKRIKIDKLLSNHEEE